MKIVDRKTFLKLPSGTVFAKYKPCFFEGLQIKLDDGNWGEDFVVQDLETPIKCDSSENFEIQCERAEKGEEVDLDFDCGSRDGLFDRDQLFAVWSRKDVQELIERLQETLK